MYNGFLVGKMAMQVGSYKFISSNIISSLLLFIMLMRQLKPVRIIIIVHISCLPALKLSQQLYQGKLALLRFWY